MAVLSVSVTVAVVRIVSRGRAMAVMVLMPIFVRRARMRMGVMAGMIVAADGYAAHCEKGDGSGELLVSLQRK